VRQINKIIVHCSDSPWGDADVIRDWHVNGNGWSDIGYHAVICNGHRKGSVNFDEGADGLIQPGRPIEKVGSHCYGHNKDSLGICLIGVEAFTPQQFYSLRQVIDVWRQYYRISTGMIRGHRDFQLTSGGKKKTCPNFDVESWLYTVVD
jgi:hypothetical protein